MLPLLLFVCAAEYAEKPQQDGVVDQVARSLLNVTEYVSNYVEPQPIPAGGGGFDFMPNTKRVCKSLPASSEKPGFQLHLIQGNLVEAQLARGTAYVLPIEFDAISGEISGMEKVYFDALNSKATQTPNLRDQLDTFPEFKQGIADAKAGAPNRATMGKAAISKDLTEQSYVVVTGGTSADKTINSDGTAYFGNLAEAYRTSLSAIEQQKEVTQVVMMPLGLGGQFQPEFVVSPEVLMFYAGNLLTYWMNEQQEAHVKNVYLIASTPEEVYAMCKYCQYRTFDSMENMGDRLCYDARMHAGTASTWLISVVLAMLWRW